jgi:hypothetical protein
MTVHLHQHHELLAELPSAAHEVLQGAWQEAARAMSPRGLDNYLKGALALHQLGRGEELVLNFLQQMPQLARAVGEDEVPGVVNFLLAMASKTSGQVLALIAASAATVAQRLGDATLFRLYLNVLELLLAQAPHGLRPLLGQIERLLAQLTLGGLRRWVQWGAKAHRGDIEAQVRYFGLDSPDALALLQQERKGTLLVDVQRRLNRYLRALWGRDFVLRPTAGDYEQRTGQRPFIDQMVIHLADAYDDLPASGTDPAASAMKLYRAGAAHCAAHLVLGGPAFDEQGLTALERALIEAVEDARIEALAIQRFPRLRQLWLSLHPSTPEPPQSAGDLINRLARAWLQAEPGAPTVAADLHPWVQQGVALLAQWPDLHDAQHSRASGIALAASLAEWMAMAGWAPFTARLDGQRAPYRDDNRYLWQAARYDETQALQAAWDARQQVRRKVSVMEMVNEVNNEYAGDDAQEIWTLPTEFMLDQEGVSINSLLGQVSLPDPVHYPEWDYTIQLNRPAWVTLQERHLSGADPAPIDAVLEQHRPLLGRLKHLIEAMSPQGMQRIRRLQDGDEIDLDPAIQALIDLRLGQQPDPRIMMRRQLHQRDLALLVLLDLSESANEKVHGQEQTVLELMRAASAILAETLTRIGDPFALHGFCSDGRHDVHYLRCKDFDQPFDAGVRARLGGLQARFSTRMGAALRHAGAQLSQRPQKKRLLLVITDGEPADRDVRDPQYLRHDARRAVEELQREGIQTFGLSLDPRADTYVERIFGARHYAVIDRIERLPERLPQLYLGLTR